MYTKFRELLDEAEGQNDWVVAINADIRGFSSIMSGDPAQTTLYLQAVYAQILDNYFNDRSFYKPTGDGLLLIVPFARTEEALTDITRKMVGEALELHDSFADMVKDNKLLRFPHPTEIGIGLSSGSVSKLIAKKLTLDYAGRSLNLASRLMDLARPSGVVFDSSLDFSSLDIATQRRFRPDHVYVKGVADEDGVDIFYTGEPTQIPERYRRPLRRAERWEEDPITFTRSEATKRVGRRYMEKLKFEPSDRSTIELVVVYPAYRGGKRLGTRERSFPAPFEYVIDRGKPKVTVNYEQIAKVLAHEKVPARVPVRLEIAYMVDMALLEEKGIQPGMG
jgi:hypothetical protein